MNPDLMMSMKARSRANREKAKNTQEVNEDLKFNEVFDSNIIDPYPLNYDSLNTTNQSNHRGYYSVKPKTQNEVFKSEIVQSKNPVVISQTKTIKNSNKEEKDNEDVSVFSQSKDKKSLGKGV